MKCGICRILIVFLLFTEKIVIRLNKKDSRVTLAFEGILHSVITLCRHVKYVAHGDLCM